jgi:hypothetical protein
MKRKHIGPNATFSVVTTTLDEYADPAPSAATCQRRLRSKIATRVVIGMVGSGCVVIGMMGASGPERRGYWLFLLLVANEASD